MQQATLARVGLGLGDKRAILPPLVFLPADTDHEDHLAAFQRRPFPVEVDVEVVEGFEIYVELEPLERRYSRDRTASDGTRPVGSQHSSYAWTLRCPKARAGFQRNRVGLSPQQALKVREPAFCESLLLYSADLVHEAGVATWYPIASDLQFCRVPGIVLIVRQVCLDLPVNTRPVVTAPDLNVKVSVSDSAQIVVQGATDCRADWNHEGGGDPAAAH